jgi:hypothetical protein
MGGAHEAKSAFKKFKEFFTSMLRLQADELKLRGELAHVLAAPG